MNKASGKDQKKKECCYNISLDHTNVQNQTIAVISLKFHKTALIKFLGEQIYLNIPSK